MRFLLSIILITVFAGCFSRTKPGFQYSTAVPVDIMPAQSPFLTTTSSGAPVISWVRMLSDSHAVFCYAVAEDGKVFGEPVVIPGSGNIQPHGENLPKMVFKPSGEIIALWGVANPNPVNKHSGLVYYAQSFDQGKTWTGPQPLVKDTAGFDQRYYDVAVLPNGEAAIIWLDNRKTGSKEGSALYFATTAGRDGFVEERMISQQCCPCCRTDLFIDKNGGIHALYRGIVRDSIRDMVHIISTDGGSSFSQPVRISEDNWVINGCPHTGPSMTENTGGLHFAWFTGGSRKGSFYTQSADGGKTFSAQHAVSEAGSHPQITGLENGNLLIAWDEAGSKRGVVSKMIGLELRNAAGKSLKKQFLTQENGYASFPVVLGKEDGNAIIAYTKKEGERSFVNYQVLIFH